MKTLKLIPVAAFLIIILLIPGSCRKPEEKILHFTWTYGNTNYVATSYRVNLLSAPDTGYSIIATIDQTSPQYVTGPRILLPSLDVGTYLLDSVTLTYNHNTYIPEHSTGGTVNITSRSNDLVSGNFNGTIINLVNEQVPISGSFTDIPIE